MKTISMPLPSFRNRKKGVNVTTIVLHDTAGASASSSWEWLKKIKLSYHYLIGDGTGFVKEDGVKVTDFGKIIKCVSTSKVAYHAGTSRGPDGSNVNEYSIGVAFASMGDRKDEIALAQWRQAVELCAVLKVANPGIKYITTHKLIAPDRKTDPNGPVTGIEDEWRNGRPVFPLKAFVNAVNKRLEIMDSPTSKLRVEAWG